MTDAILQLVKDNEKMSVHFSSKSDEWETRGEQDAFGIRDTEEPDDIAKQKAVRVIRAQEMEMVEGRRR